MILQSNLYNSTTGPIALTIPSKVFPAVASNDSLIIAPDTLSKQIMNLAKSDLSQNRKGMTYNPLIYKVALARCQDMALHGYVAHKGFDGHYINWYLRQAGYKLPSWYGFDENNCESIAAGTSTPIETWTAWLNHPPHRIHVLGENKFWADQVDFAIAHYAAPVGSLYPHYWVFVSARK